MNAVVLSIVILAQGVWIAANPEVECANVQDKKLCAELLLMGDRDQLSRRNQLDVDFKTVDAENQKRLDEIMSTSGWPTQEMVGKRAAGAVWAIIQHAPLEYQKKYFDSMKNMAEAGELDRSLVATTEDRIRLREGQKQLYGTQFNNVDGEITFQPIEDEEHVDERRASVGLPPLSEYRKLIEQMYPRKRMTKN